MCTVKDIFYGIRFFKSEEFWLVGGVENALKYTFICLYFNKIVLLKVNFPLYCKKHNSYDYTK